MSDGYISLIEVSRAGQVIGQIDASMMDTGSVIETASLSGPRLIATFRDEVSILSEGMQITEGDNIKVQISDTETNDVPIDYDFTCLAVLAGSDSTMIVEALEAQSNSLKSMAGKFIVSIDGSIEDAISILVDGTGIENFNIGSFPKPYVVCASNQTRSQAIARLALENGAIAYIGREGLTFHTRNELFSSPVTIGNSSLISSISRCGIENNIFNTLSARTWVGWSIIDGPISDGSGPVQFVARDSIYDLQRLSEQQLIPFIDMITLGETAIQAGMGIKLVTTANIGDPISDTLSGNYIVETAAHHFTQGIAHRCRVYLAKHEVTE